MRVPRFFAAAILLLASFTAPAVAETREVRANRTTVVEAMFVTEGKSCRYLGKLKHSVPGKPKHGRIDVSYERHVVNEGRCAGRQVGLMLIRYTPNRGYRGKDSAVVSIRWPEFNGAPSSRSKRYKLDINVK
ncbi:hypothetical protein [Oricola sp.]|uniref:hypothetical protein n=1 Tax=Oricola sp. TaxID=1979950 RepID=UPI003BA920E1